MNLRFLSLGLALPWLALLASASAPSTDAIRYSLDRDGFVTLVIEQPDGSRIRNLFAQAPRSRGEHLESWDGLDDAGRPVAAGTYRWRGLVHDGIHAHFVGELYSPGDPPWVTSEVPAQWHIRASGRGGWLADHSAPLAVAAHGDRVFIGAPVAEAGHAIIAVDLEGRKIWGTLWFAQSGAHAIASHGDVVYIAGEGGWLGKRLAIHRIDAHTYRPLAPPPQRRGQQTDTAFLKHPQTEYSGIRGLTVCGRHLVLALADHGRLVLWDRETGDVVRELPMPRPGGIVAESDSRLLAISGDSVVRVDLDTGVAQAVITNQLTGPVGITRDASGQLYVSDAEQCVKVFAADGTFLRRIGQPGGRQEGLFDPRAMGRPHGLTVDSRGRLWVAENFQLPKRVSVWTTQGDLVRDFVGPPYYGGGAALDPQIAGRGYYKGMVFDWQPWPGRSRLRAVTFLPEKHPDVPFVRRAAHVPQYPVYHQGRCYLVHDAGWAAGGVFIGELRDWVLRPLVAFGSLRALREIWPSHPTPERADGAFLWQDLNEDGNCTPDEITIREGWNPRAEWSLRAWPTLTLVARSSAGLHLLRPIPDSAPLRYDPQQFLTVPATRIKPHICSLVVSPGGEILISEGGQATRGERTNRLLALNNEGKILWSYPNPYPSNSHASPRPSPGDILHTLGFEGFARTPGGQWLFQLGGNKGSRYLFTLDGLFVSELFSDIRLGVGLHTVHHVERGQALESYNLGDEVFGGWLGNTPDGAIHQILGKEHCSIFEVRGLETIRRLEGGEVRLSTPASAAPVADPKAPQPVAVLFGGVSRNWQRLNGLPLPPSQPRARFLLAADRDALQLAVRVEDSSPFVNRGEDPAELCRTGDAVDFRIRTPAAGDQRFIVAPRGEEAVVVRYRYKVPGTTAPREFVSPTGQVTVDAIEVLSSREATVRVERTTTGYELRLRLRWEAMGLTERPTGPLRGDVGVIFSDPDGHRAVAREYYFDPESREVSDLPSEIRVNPERWGEFRF